MKPETKVTAGSVTAVVSGAVSYLLTAYVFHNSLSPDVQAIIPVAVSAVLGSAAAYLAPHTSRPAVPPAAAPAAPPVTPPASPAAP